MGDVDRIVFDADDQRIIFYSPSSAGGNYYLFIERRYTDSRQIQICSDRHFRSPCVTDLLRTNVQHKKTIEQFLPHVVTDMEALREDGQWNSIASGGCYCRFRLSHMIYTDDDGKKQPTWIIEYKSREEPEICTQVQVSTEDLFEKFREICGVFFDIKKESIKSMLQRIIDEERLNPSPLIDAALAENFKRCLSAL